jgi:cytochrome c-type biogenesis protein CcmH
VTKITKALRELLLAQAAGMIDPEEFERRQAALHAELLAEHATAEKKRWWMLGVAAGVVALAIGVYAWKTSGSAGVPASPPPMMSAAPAAPTDPAVHANSGGDLKAMSIRLAEKLAKNPTNGEGWGLLAQTYMELRQYKEADAAFAKAAATGKVDARQLADWADAHVIANNGKWDKTARDILARAMAADNKQLKVLALAGSEAFDRAEYKQAIAHWKKMRELAPADSMDAKLADANIAEATAAMTGKRPAAPDVKPELKAR